MNGERKKSDIGKFYRCERKNMIAAIWRMCGQDAEDVVQDAMCKALKGNGNIKNIRGYLYRSVFNAAYDYLRRKQSEPQFAEFESFIKIVDGDFYDGFEVEINRIKDAGARKTILLRSQGHTYESISKILNVPLGTIKSRINRARIQLLENMQKK